MLTSLIPSVLALSSFFSSHFPDVSWYPYWYLGNPFHYLIGPVVPVVLHILSQALPVSLYYLYISCVLAGMVINGIGLYVLLKDWGIRKYQALYSALFYLVFPASVYVLQGQTGLKHFGFLIVPFALLFYRRFLLTGRKIYLLSVALCMAFGLLISASLFLSFIIAFIAMAAYLYQHNLSVLKGKERDAAYNLFETRIVQTILLILLALGLSTFWYTPKFWWIVLVNPSFGGVPLFVLAGKIFNTLLTVLPIIIAVYVVKWRNFKPQGYVLFGFLFFISFLFLTLVRFVSDPDFVADWIGFIPELQFGAAVLAGGFIAKYKRLRTVWYVFLVIFTGLSLLIWSNIFNYSKSEYKADISTLLNTPQKDNYRTFLSGSPVFWINSVSDIQQVRGNNDGVSINPSWADGAYQIREGEKEDPAKNWLRVFGTPYILVNDETSKEPYHDFRNIEKFENFELINEKNGNYLLRTADISNARIADKNILGVRKPYNGADNETLTEYSSFIKENAQANYKNPSTLEVSGTLHVDEVLSIAVTHDPHWKITQGNGVLRHDSFGNMVIVPQNPGKQGFQLQYMNSLSDILAPSVFSLLLIIFIWQYDRLFPHVKRKLPKLSLGLKEDEDDY